MDNQKTDLPAVQAQALQAGDGPDRNTSQSDAGGRLMTEKEYKPQETEAKWQKKWESDKVFTPDLASAAKPYYTLMMFPYPSAEGLHVGNMYAFTGADVHGRFRRMQGYDVFEPIGLDGFGIHSENYALKVGKHPAEQAKISEKNFYRQLRATGNGYDWTRTLETYDPDYYRWTQWLFIQLFKKGLAYRKKAKVNWCPSDKTVLADEQVIDGKCERDGAIIEKRDLEQWFFKITEYADELLDGLKTIDWPQKVKIAQEQWIGKSEGAKIAFRLQTTDHRRQAEDSSQSTVDSIEVFTTRPDTLFGATFMVVSPEHPIVSATDDDKVREYVEAAKGKTEAERQENREKTGVFTGLYAINPVNNEEIPIWVADYVLMGYGTGAIMAVPAHDTRDFEFAKKFGLPIRQVIAPDEHFGPLRQGESEASKELPELAEAYVGPGGLVNSGDWDDYAVPAAMPKIFAYIEEKGIGERESNYHLRDWLISRQRYWGPPIPMIYCENCESAGKGEREDMPGWWTVPEEDLPVLLPDVEDWRPEGSGTSPLANHPEFYETKCPSCSEKSRRETDVSDTFLDSAWYYLRYLSIQHPISFEENPETMSEEIKAGQKHSNENSQKTGPYDLEAVKKWCPVAIYIGGAEHSVLHLLYVRFIAMVLADLKNQPQLPFREPFPRFFAHGLIVKDGAKMSKSRGNVVVPDKYIEKFGADTVRLYLMFLGQFRDGGDFRDSGIEGMNRFVRRVWKLFTTKEFGDDSDTTIRMINKTVKEVTEDVESFSYNTAIAKLMEFYNYISEEQSWSKETATAYLKLFAPFAPHFTEELWERLKTEDLKPNDKNDLKSDIVSRWSIHYAAWPTFDEKYLTQEEVIIPIQVNGKRRGEITIDNSQLTNEKEVEEKAKGVISTHLEGKEVKKVIYVPGKIINFVV